MARRAIKAPVLWSKSYYGETFLDDSISPANGRETGQWSGTLFVYEFNIVQYKTKNRLIIEPDIKRFSGGNKEEMESDLEKAVEGMDEWDTKGKNYRVSKVFWPEEVDKKLQEFNVKI